MALIPVPGAEVLTSSQLTGAMSVPVLGPARSAIATLAALGSFLGVSSAPLALAALTTVGAGTVPAASIAGGAVARGGTQTAAVADTTDTAGAIIAAMPNAVIGQSFLFYYQNNTTDPVTLGGGTGVTVSGITVIPAGATALYVVKYTAAATVTMTGLLITPPATFSGTVTANAATPVTVANVNVQADSTIILTYKSGTQGATGAFVNSKTAGTGFHITSVTGDTAVYDYLIIN